MRIKLLLFNNTGVLRYTGRAFTTSHNPTTELSLDTFLNLFYPTYNNVFERPTFKQLAK